MIRVEDIKPSLLHGDLWSGNYSATKVGPTIYDPACYYGHYEADHGINYMFGGEVDCTTCRHTIDCPHALCAIICGGSVLH
jgi:protein-ribulosamine 3-kinase